MTNRLTASSSRTERDRDPSSRLPDASVVTTASLGSHWYLPEPLEPRYAYPVLVLVRSVREADDPGQALAEERAWVDAIGRQNAAIVCVGPIAEPTDESVDRAPEETLDLLIGQALLMRPPEIELRDDRVFVAGCGTAGLTAFRAWQTAESRFAGVVCVRPPKVPSCRLASGRQAGRLLVTGGTGWRRTAMALFAAGAHVELRPGLNDLPTTAAAINGWLMRSIPTAVGLSG